MLDEKARSFVAAPFSGAMPTEHEQIIQRGFDAFETADMDAFTAHWHPDVEPGRPEPVPIEMGIVYTLEADTVRLMQVHTGHEAARRTAGV